MNTEKASALLRDALDGDAFDYFGNRDGNGLKSVGESQLSNRDANILADAIRKIEKAICLLEPEDKKV